MRKWQTSLCCIRQQVSFSHGYISLSNILTNRQSIGDAGRRRFVIRLPLKEQWDCVWLLLADHNTMKKELLRGTNDTSPYEWHHFPSIVSSKDKHIKEEAKIRPEKPPNLWRWHRWRNVAGYVACQWKRGPVDSVEKEEKWYKTGITETFVQSSSPLKNRRQVINHSSFIVSTPRLYLDSFL